MMGHIAKASKNAPWVTNDTIYKNCLKFTKGVLVDCQAQNYPTTNNNIFDVINT